MPQVTVLPSDRPAQCLKPNWSRCNLQQMEPQSTPTVRRRSASCIVHFSLHQWSVHALNIPRKECTHLSDQQWVAFFFHVEFEFQPFSVRTLRESLNPKSAPSRAEICSLFDGAKRVQFDRGARIRWKYLQHALRITKQDTMVFGQCCWCTRITFLFHCDVYAPIRYLLISLHPFLTQTIFQLRRNYL